MNDVEADSETTGEIETGCKLFVLMYGGKKNDSLNNLRFVKYMEMVTSSKKIESHKLPPTARAAFFPSLREHLQVVIWKSHSVHLPPGPNSVGLENREHFATTNYDKIGSSTGRVVEVY